MAWVAAESAAPGLRSRYLASTPVESQGLTTVTAMAPSACGAPLMNTASSNMLPSEVWPADPLPEHPEIVAAIKRARVANNAVICLFIFQSVRMVY